MKKHGLGGAGAEAQEVDSQVRVNPRHRRMVSVAEHEDTGGHEEVVPDMEDTESDNTGSLPRGGCSPLSTGVASSEVLSIAETIAKSMQQVTQVMLGQAEAQTKVLATATQGLTKLPKLKVTGRNKPTVKAVRQWL